MRQLAESRQRLLDLRAVREEEVSGRALHAAMQASHLTALLTCGNVMRRGVATPSAHATFPFPNPNPRCVQVRQLHSIMARQLVESIHEVERRQASLVRRQEVLLQLCRQLLQERHQHQHAQHFSGAGGGGSGSGGAGGSSCKATAAGGAAEARGVARRDACGSAGSAG